MGERVQRVSSKSALLHSCQ